MAAANPPADDGMLDEFQEVVNNLFIFTAQVAATPPSVSKQSILSSEQHFNKALSDFCVAGGTTPTQSSRVLDQFLDSSDRFKLFKEIAAEGGFDQVTQLKWTSICASLGIEAHLSQPLKDAYAAHLLTFDRYVNGSLEPEPESTPPAPAAETQSQPPPAETFRDKILDKRAEIEELFQHFQPGSSAEGFLSFYESEQSAMASTRSSLREGLRQAPKVNQPFVPDTAPVRQTRSGANASSSAQGTPSGQTPSSHLAGPDTSNPTSAQFNIDHFEGRDTRQVPMSTRDVATPGNKPDAFNQTKTKDPKKPDFYDFYYPLKYLEIPRSPSIYRRVHFGLQSGIPDEVDFALFHLVQMSYQRGDKLRFEGFPLLMETLMEKAMEITELLTGIKWELERDQYRWPENKHRPNVLNTLWGTHDILDRIRQLPITLPNDTLVTYDYADHMRQIQQATLVLRNMCTLPENAVFIASYAKGLLHDFLCVMLNTPEQPRFNELKNDALDIAEEVTKYLPTAPDDPLCISLYRFTKSEDRAHILRSLWAITHFSTELPGAKNQAMLRVDEEYITYMFYHLLVEQDPELINAAMDFWYQYTLVPENLETLVDVMNVPVVLMPRLVNLLTYEAEKEILETVIQEEKRAPPISTIPKVPQELLKELMELSEPERSSKWLRCCFVEDADCEITQIALWQAYQTRFVNPQQPNSGVLPAAEFIKNVSTTFANAQAQVVPLNGAGGQTTKFIIKGIRPLETALTLDNWPYQFCEWSVGTQPNQPCDRAFARPEDLRAHVFEDHMGLTPGTRPYCYNLQKADEPIHRCLWEGCDLFRQPSDDTYKVASHVGASHLPLPRGANEKPPSYAREVLQPRLVRRSSYYNTPVNSQGEPYGIAYKACLVLRNLAENLPNEKLEKLGNMSWRKACFITRREAIMNKWDHNRSLRLPLTDVLLLIDKAVWD